MFNYDRERASILTPADRLKNRELFPWKSRNSLEGDFIISSPKNRLLFEEPEFFASKNRRKTENLFRKASFYQNTIHEPNINTATENKSSIYQPCIVDFFGEPISKKKDTSKIIVSEINDQLLYELTQKPDLLYSLTPYNFELVIAKIFEKRGFSVKITPQTCDGGKDIFVAKNDLCSFLFYVECKKYSPDHHVGIDIIQRLYGVISAEKATGGIIATTSYFTDPAKDYIQKHQLNHQITLHDYNVIINNLKSLNYDI